MTALDIIKDENLVERSFKAGQYLRKELSGLNRSVVSLVRGRGLLNAIVIEPKAGRDAWDFCLLLKENGLLAKPTHGDIIRLAPPLIISDEQLQQCVEIIQDTVDEFAHSRASDHTNRHASH
jgi:ornithine--oxo-acid transaminase